MFLVEGGAARYGASIMDRLRTVRRNKKVLVGSFKRWCLVPCPANATQLHTLAHNLIFITGKPPHQTDITSFTDATCFWDPQEVSVEDLAAALEVARSCLGLPGQIVR